MQGQRQDTKSHAQVYYLMDFGMYSPADVELFCGYKHFIENTIVELGDDWRIQSGLLSQEIIAVLKEQPKNDEEGHPIEDTDHEFNIFNEFLLPFLKDKVGRQTKARDCLEADMQEQYTQAIELHFSKNQKIIDSLTFKTLSLGFFITAIDQWQESFSSFTDESLPLVELTPFGILKANTERNPLSIFNLPSNQEFALKTKIEHNQFRSCHLSEQFKKSSDQYDQHSWKILNNISFLSKSELRSLIYGLKKIKKKPHKALAISNFATSIYEVKVQDRKCRILSINNDFYKWAFIVWLLFNVKLFFTLNFEQYLLYFKKLTSNWHESLELPLKKFFLIVDQEWSLLFKDLSVALHDELEVLKKLIERVRRQYHKMWAMKRSEIEHRFCQ